MAGKLKDDVLKMVTDAVALVPGDFAEVGVYRADLFKRLVPIANAQGRLAHGFDSFQGMAKPTAQDSGEYEEGKLSVGGIKVFKRILDAADVNGGYALYQGYVPDCLLKLPPSVRFSFAYIDLDQYLPTVVALEWVHPLIAVGGILGLDDYFPKKCLASLAIDEFRSRYGRQYELFHYGDNQLFLRKL